MNALTRWDASSVLLVAGLMAAHYAVPERVLWPHVVLFWSFQIVVLIGAATRGIRGGLATAVILSTSLLPLAIALTRRHGASASMIWMELVSLYIIGISAGWLRDRWRREQEMGERTRELKVLARILESIRQDLSGPIRSTRRLLLSLEPLRERQPALVPAIRGIDSSLGPAEALMGRLQNLRVDPRVSLVRFDKVLEATRDSLTRMSAPGPGLSIEWRCAPPTIPASRISLSSALATLLIDLAPASSVVRVTVRRAGSWIVLDLCPAAGVPGRVPAPGPAPLASLEIANQVVRAHGGRVQREFRAADATVMRVHIPCVLRIRSLAQEVDIAGGREPVRAPRRTVPIR